MVNLIQKGAQNKKEEIEHVFYPNFVKTITQERQQNGPTL